MKNLSSVLLRNLRLICARDGELDATDLLVKDGVIQAVTADSIPSSTVHELDCSGMFACQGFVDLLAEGGEPGNEDREDFVSLGETAIRAGFTTLCVSPDTQPVNDARSVTEWIHRRAALNAQVEILPIAAATRGLEGHALADLFDLKEAGVAGVQLGRGSLSDSGMMRRAYEYAKGLELLVFERPLDMGLHRGGLMHEGRWATEAGVKGSPSAAEDVSVSRAIALASLVESPIHIGPLSSARSVEMVRRAKADGLPVSSSVNVLNLVYTSQLVRELMHPSLNVVPPLRDESDRKALLTGIADGTIDAISSGHSAQTSADKQRPFEWSTPGACTIPVVVPLLLGLVERGDMELAVMVRALCQGSRAVLNRNEPSLKDGGGNNLVVIDPTERWTPSTFRHGSKGRNLPVFSKEVRGRVYATLVKGNVYFNSQRGEQC